MIVSFAVSVSIKNNSLKKHLNFPTHAIKTKIYGFPVKIMIKYKHEEKKACLFGCCNHCCCIIARNRNFEICERQKHLSDGKSIA